MLYSQVIDDALEDRIGKAGLPRATLVSGRSTRRCCAR